MVWSAEEEAALVGIHDEAVTMGFDTLQKQGLDKMLDIAFSRGLMLRYQKYENRCHARTAVRKTYLELMRPGYQQRKHKKALPRARQERDKCVHKSCYTPCTMAYRD